MINELMRKRSKEEKQEKVKRKANNPKIEVLKSESVEKAADEEEKEEEEKKGEDLKLAPEFVYAYGFNRAYKRFFDDLEEEMLEMTDLQPDNTNLCKCSKLTLNSHKA